MAGALFRAFGIATPALSRVDEVSQNLRGKTTDDPMIGAKN